MATSRRNRERVNGMPLKVFPVDPAGKPTVSDDFGKPRGDKGERSHQGNDIFAPEGTPVLAVDDGKLTHRTNRLGGTVAFLHAKDGVRYYYAHLQGYEGPAREVKAGEVIAYVGKTGNAASTAPHLHFEISPSGSGRDNINPFPLLQDVAIEAVPSGATPKPPRRQFSFQLDGVGLLVVVGLVYYFSKPKGGRRKPRLLATAF